MRKSEMILIAGAGLAAAAAALASETVTYGYDARGRLVRVDHAGNVNNGAIVNYVYDKADNRTLRNVSGAP
ncbi:MAG TPA: hypothetical protein VEX35_14395 [Allosphingosinicella sp.]|nr:hypothetical protein [Allosphingosinicella sp.]